MGYKSNSLAAITGFGGVGSDASSSPFFIDYGFQIWCGQYRYLYRRDISHRRFGIAASCFPIAREGKQLEGPVSASVLTGSCFGYYVIA